MTKDLKNAYSKVYRDMILHGPDFFRGVYDAQNGSKNFMFGVQTVMEFITSRISDVTQDAYTDMFVKNVIRCEEKANAGQDKSE